MGWIKKEGELVKSPPKKKMETKSSWHNRYFVLAQIDNTDYSPTGKKKLRSKETTAFGMYLMYWKNYNDRKNGRPIRIIPIRRDCNVSYHDSECFPHMMENLIKLETPERTFILSATSKELMIEWYQCLNEARCDSENKSNGIYEPILDFTSWWNSRSPSIDDDRCSSFSTQTSNSSGIGSSIIPAENNYQDMSRNSPSSRIRSVSDMSHYDIPKSERQRSTASLSSTFSVRSLDNHTREVTFEDFKMIVPCDCIISLSGDSLEIETEQLKIMLEKKQQLGETTKL